MAFGKFVINVSDSFVHPVRKMEKQVGNVGHGERRLYVGNDEMIAKKLTTKPWMFDFSTFVEPRTAIHVDLVQQDGMEDTRRFYVGVKGTTKENKDKFDELRKSLIPQKTCFVVEETPDCFRATVIESEKVDVKKGKGYSKAALRWLEYEARTRNIVIQHAENGGEFSIRTKKGYKWPVDGFCKETGTVFEFHGDYYHGNPKKFKGTDLYHGKPYAEKWAKDAEKRKCFEELGYTVVVMWEGDWIETEKSLKMANVLQNV